MLLAHAGNRVDPPDRPDERFPASNVADVRARVSRLLDALRPEGLVSAAAAGADLIVLEAAAAAGIPVHVVLPLTQDDFEQASVADLGADWVGRYRRLVAQARGGDSTVTERGLAPEGDWFEAANRLILARARDLATTTGVPLAALAIRPPLEGEGERGGGSGGGSGGGTGEPSVTDDFVALARGDGVPVIDLDPARPRNQLRRAVILQAGPRAARSHSADDGVVDKLVVPALEDADLDWRRGATEPLDLVAADVLVVVVAPGRRPTFLDEGAEGWWKAIGGKVTVVVSPTGPGGDVLPGPLVGTPEVDLRRLRYRMAGRCISDTEAMAAWADLAALVGPPLSVTGAGTLHAPVGEP